MSWIDVIEAAYATGGDEPTWLSGVVQASRPLLDAGLGIHGLCYTTDQASRAVRLGPVHDRGYSPEMRMAFPKLFGAQSPEALGRVLRLGGCSTISRRLADLPDDLALFATVCRPLGFADAIGVIGGDPSGCGFMLAAPLPKRATAQRLTVARWARVSAHIVAGYRLQRSTASRAPAVDAFADAEAVLDERARVKHARGVAEAASVRVGLRAAAIRLMHARSQRARQRDELAAVASWRALVAGRWSLVDQFDTDGRRFLIARRNDPAAPTLEKLTLRERQVVGYVALGHSNKLIAYELGLSPTTVATHLTRAATKLRVRSRAALISAYAMKAIPSTKRDE